MASFTLLGVNVTTSTIAGVFSDPISPCFALYQDKNSLHLTLSEVNIRKDNQRYL